MEAKNRVQGLFGGGLGGFWGILTPQPKGSWPFSAPRAFTGATGPQSKESVNLQAKES